MEKICTKCHIELPSTAQYWYRQLSTKDGLQCRCKACTASHIKQHKTKHRDRYTKQMRLYRSTLRGKLRVVYCALNSRCNNPENPRYEDWGGRGILNLFDSFEDFYFSVTTSLQFDSINKLKGLVLDRIDNDKHYSLGNIRFVTPAESNKNRRKRYKRRRHEILTDKIR